MKKFNKNTKVRFKGSINDYPYDLNITKDDIGIIKREIRMDNDIPDSYFVDFENEGYILYEKDLIQA